MELGALLADPGKYAGVRVRFPAYLMNEFEDHGLYEDETSVRDPPSAGPRFVGCKSRMRSPPMRALWWDTTLDAEVSYNRQLVVIEGTFDPCEEGHMGLFGGGVHGASFTPCGTGR